MNKKQLIRVNKDHFIDIEKIRYIQKVNGFYYLNMGNDDTDEDIQLKNNEFDNLMKYLDIIDITQKGFLSTKDTEV